MGVTYNGFREGESRVHKMRPRKADGGHSLINVVTTRPGWSFTFHYRLTCQCGRQFGSKRTMESAWYRFNAHREAEQSK